MRVIQNTIGVLLVLAGAYMSFLTFGFATLAAGGLEDGSTQWWATVLGVMFEAPAIYIFMAGMMGGLALCLHRPGEKIRVRRVAAIGGVLAILIGLLWEAASQERLWIEKRFPNPDGTSRVIREYRNWFGKSRTVETVEES